MYICIFTGVKSGKLLKKGKERGCWLERHFMLDRLTNTIAYYDKASTTVGLVSRHLFGSVNISAIYVVISGCSDDCCYLHICYLIDAQFICLLYVSFAPVLTFVLIVKSLFI